MISSLSAKRFQVALSFPGEKRDFIASVASGLSEKVEAVFYDHYFEAELARPDLDLLLQEVYYKNCELIVVFICEEYNIKEWCGLEWRAIREVLKKRNAEDIMFMRFDDVEVPGFLSLDGYIDLRNRTPAEVVDMIYRRLKSSKSTGQNLNSIQSDRFLAEASPRSKGTNKKGIFVSYEKEARLDRDIAFKVYNSLRENCNVYMRDEVDKFDTTWARKIEWELRNSDFLVVLISPGSSKSEMLQGEVRMAHQLNETDGKKIKIIPVKLLYTDLIPYPLNHYIDSSQSLAWQNERDTFEIIRQIEWQIHEEPIPASVSAPLESINASCVFNGLPTEEPGGAMSIDSPFYIERNSDKVALHSMAGQGVTLTIKGARQTGKSSLLVRVMGSCLNAGKNIIYVDFQMFERAALENSDEFFRQFCQSVADSLSIDDGIEKYWKSGISNPLNCTRYMRDCVLKNTDSPIVLAMDEVESVFTSSFCTDFFGMLRSWHGNRASPLTKVWKKLDLVLITSTEPYRFILDKNQSPFNVGTVVHLQDFSAEQIAQLNGIYGDKLSPTHAHPHPEDDLRRLLGGHPYLTHRAFHLLCSGQTTIDSLFKTAYTDNSLFGDHLKYHLFQLRNRKDLCQGLLEVIRYNNCRTEETVDYLEGAGLVRRFGREVRVRCDLYGHYFQGRIDG